MRVLQPPPHPGLTPAASYTNRWRRSRARRRWPKPVPERRSHDKRAGKGGQAGGEASRLAKKERVGGRGGEILQLGALCSPPARGTLPASLPDSASHTPSGSEGKAPKVRKGRRSPAEDRPGPAWGKAAEEGKQQQPGAEPVLREAHAACARSLPRRAARDRRRLIRKARQAGNPLSLGGRALLRRRLLPPGEKKGGVGGGEEPQSRPAPSGGRPWGEAEIREGREEGPGFGSRELQRELERSFP